MKSIVVAFAIKVVSYLLIETIAEAIQFFRYFIGHRREFSI